jgi:hypothetical protein
LGFIFILLLSSTLDVLGIHNMQFFLGVGMASGVGIMQWRMLNRKKRISKNWIWHSILALGGSLLCYDIASISFDYVRGNESLFYCLMLGAVLAGTLQYRILAPQYGKARLWIPACILGWTGAIGTVLMIDIVKHFFESKWLLFSINLTLILSGGLVIGLITGKFISIITNAINRKP